MKISVIIPVYNAEKHINKSLISLEKQSIFKQLEIIIINDGSKDKSKEIIEKFSSKHDNVKIINQDNAGVSVARNRGIEAATCKYIAFLDADDYLDTDFYEYLLNSIEEHKSKIVICGFVVEYTNSKIKIERKAKSKKIIKNNEIIKEFLITKDVDPNIWNKIYLTDLVKKIKFDKELHIAEDKWFLFQYLTIVKEIVVLPEAKYHYLINDTSACRKDFDEKKFGPLIVCERILKVVKEKYSELTELAECYCIDVKCRLYNELVASQNYKKYKKEARQLKKEINQFSILKKMRNSTKKHMVTFLLTKISPKLYMFIRNTLKFQYKT